ncbi:N-acetyltransferase family protein [Methylomonas sp. MgM2]
MTYSYRKATAMDREAIFELYRQIMHDYIAEIWGWNEDWQTNDFAAHFNPEGITLVYEGKQLVGYAHIDNNKDHIFLRMLAIHRNHQRNGIGTHLLLRLITSGQEQSKTVSLEVFKINMEAKRFYERLGFKVVGESLHSYVMRLNA